MVRFLVIFSILSLLFTGCSSRTTGPEDTGTTTDTGVDISTDTTPPDTATTDTHDDSSTADAADTADDTDSGTDNGQAEDTGSAEDNGQAEDTGSAEDNGQAEDTAPSTDTGSPDSGSSDGGTVSTECSSYAVTVEVPPYDSSNPEHFLIQTDTDWNHINDADKRVFYVAPGDYQREAEFPISITASGTAEKPRFLALDDNTDLHPAQLDTEEQASVWISFSGASHWTVSRLSALNYNNKSLQIWRCHHIVIDRMHFKNFEWGVRVDSGPDDSTPTHDITIQHCRMDSMSPEGIAEDAVAVFLKGSEDVLRRVEDVHILDNEIRNCNDGIQLFRNNLPDVHEVNYPGTVIDCNHIYVDSEVYTDGEGNYDPNGLWAGTENAIDLKGGSDDPTKPIIVSNNFLWGWRHTDLNVNDTGSSGSAFGGHYHVKNIEVFNNVVFDSNRGLVFADPGDAPTLTYSVENLHVHDNIFYEIGFNPEGDTEPCHFFYDSANVLYEHNTVVGGEANSRWFSFYYDAPEVGLVVSCNAIVDSEVMEGARAPDTTVVDNFFYNTLLQEPGDGTSYPTAAEAQLEDLVFTTDRYTNSPRQITLPGVVTTPASPHAGWCAP